MPPTLPSLPAGTTRPPEEWQLTVTPRLKTELRVVAKRDTPVLRRCYGIFRANLRALQILVEPTLLAVSSFDSNMV